MKKILIVAGGEWQVPLVQSAKRLGLEVFNSNLYPESPAFPYCDHHLVADVLDIAKNLEYAQSNQINAIATDQSDIAVPTVAYIAEKLGLPGIGMHSANLFTNKYLMRTFCKEHGFPTPAFQFCSTPEDVKNFAESYGYPLVIKPPANQSSRGVHKISSSEEIKVCFANALSHSADGHLIAEEFIPGTELTIDGIQVNAGTHHSLAISTKKHYTHNEMIARQLIFTSAHPEINFNQLREQHNQLIAQMNLPFGLTHAEYKYHQGKFYLVEVAARGGGTLISSDIVPMVSQVDSNSLLLRMACGEQITSIQPHFDNKATALSFLSFKAGIVKSVAGLDQALKYPGVHKIQLNIRTGSTIKPPEDDRSRHGFIIASADSIQELNTLVEKLEQTITIEYV